MRRLLAASLIALSLSAVSDAANSQPADNPVKGAPPCVTTDYIRPRLAEAGLEERAYLSGDPAQRLLRAARAPDTATAVLVLRVIGQPARLVLVIFNEQGCQIGMGAGPTDAVEQLIAPPGQQT